MYGKTQIVLNAFVLKIIEGGGVKFVYFFHVYVFFIVSYYFSSELT